ncbi:hypothetical protein Sango_2901700 [Sesamum angolense]|uniref:CCHC-type domain-containing protein n=1 Tax=Sesamum angolense TaxID=2727404 RepID=A0AAE1T5T3_9LAMI|nr:hypothetical protein Sango_2901700 [Sesamum angolense]
MVMKRPARHVHMPPPPYHPKSESITLCLHYGGEARHVPEALYEGGSLCKFDYVLPNEVCIESLDLFSDSVGIEKGRRYYTIVNKGFKLLIDNNDFKREWKKVLKYREMLIYVEGAVGEGDGEKNVVGERAGEEDVVGKGAGEGDAVGKGDAVSEGEAVSEGDGQGDKDILVDSDYEIEGDKIEEQVKEAGMVEEQIWWEGDGHSHPVFNPTEIYDPIFELGMLFTNKNEVRKTNPGSTVLVGTEQIEGEERFNRFYMCFGALKAGFRAGCRPIIGVDGCHLKGPHGGILLTAVGVDPNNNLFPIAYAVVSKECRETWEWFLILLKHDLDIVRQDEYTFMSDKQKGLIQAFEEVFPARACTVGEWKMRMQEMKKISESAHDWFNDKPVQWSRSHFNCYSVDTYRKVYEPAIQPMSHEGLWSESLIIPLYPNFGRGPGRPAKARRREADEPSMKNKKKSNKKQVLKLRRHQTTVHCRTCGEPGHNTAKCPEREGETRSTLDQRASKKAVESKVGKRKAVDNIIEDNSNEIEHGGSSGTQYPNILPPLHTEAEPTPEACITQQETVSQPPAVPVYKAGPSMYEQLSMSNKHMTLQSRVQIRAPPPMIGPQRIPVFSSVSRAQSGTIKPIITEGGQKYLDLSQFSSSDAH